MSAEIKPVLGSESLLTASRKPLLLNKLEGHQDIINQAIFLPDEDGVVSISDDKSVRIWLKRDTGQYWPSICHFMTSPVTALCYDKTSKLLFVGLENGAVSEFKIADDFNSMSNTKNYSAHRDRVTGICHAFTKKWVLSIGKDKYFQWHCTITGYRLGGFQCEHCCTTIQFDLHSKHVFIGDSNGTISMLKIEDGGYKHITTLKGHSSNVCALLWGCEAKLLFSGGADNSVMIWDIGGQKGTAYEFNGHHHKVTALCCSGGPKPKCLISGCEDGTIVFWDMIARRKVTPHWAESDVCQRCLRPFYWNVKAMMTLKTIGLRQHHCRRCGNAVCDKCSCNCSSIPILGYEYPVRVCDECFSVITESDRTSLALFYDAHHCILEMAFDEFNHRILTVGTDRIIKLWDISSIIV